MISIECLNNDRESIYQVHIEDEYYAAEGKNLEAAKQKIMQMIERQIDVEIDERMKRRDDYYRQI